MAFKGSFVLLNQKLSLNYSQLYPNSYSNEELKYQIISEILNTHYPILASQGEYLFIVTITRLLEKFLNDKEKLQQYSSYIQSIVSSLKLTNKKIREVHGYNLDLSKVFYILISFLSI